MHIIPLEITSPIWLSLIVIAGIAGIITFIMIADDLPTLTDNSFANRMKALIIKLSIFVIAAATIILSIASMVNIAHRNGDTFISNLKQKYQISEVVKLGGLSNVDSYLGFEEMSGETIEIKTTDGTRVIFLVSVDPKTFEPTLENPPIMGGGDVNKAPSPKDLLKGYDQKNI